jgi:thiamine biosynthesis protein ThiI
MRVLVLLSGGIDSPVAAYSMVTAGAEVLALHMDNRPYSDSEARARKLGARLRKVTCQKIPLFIAPHGKFVMAEIEKAKNTHIRCVLCKRFMLRVAEAVASKEKCGAIVMGDSLGQVASQTLRNILIEQEAIKMPVLRPLIGFDKTEIMKIANEIGTYELSIENAGDCGLVPKGPSTHAQMMSIKEAEAGMDVEGMVSACLAEARKE